MANETHQDPNGSPQSFFVRGDFPFVFMTNEGFTSTNDLPSDMSSTIADRMTPELTDEKEKAEALSTDEVKTETDERDDLRISQPQYSDLLKQLDFRFTRMVDVTDLLPGQNEHSPPLIVVEEVDDLSSSSSSSSGVDPPLNAAVDEIQNELNHLAAIIQEASQVSNENVSIVIEEKQKKSPRAEEDDDTSKQATQDYDLHTNEKEELVQSNSMPRLQTQHSNSTQDENLSSIPRLNIQIHLRTDTDDHPISWENLLNGSNAFIQSADEPQTTPSQFQPSASRDPRAFQSSPSSSEESDSIVEPILHRSKAQPFPIFREPSPDDDLDELKTQLRRVLRDQEHPTSSTTTTVTHERARPHTTTASDLLLRRLAEQQQTRTSSGTHLHRPRATKPNTTDTWVAMLEKLEREHKHRLEQQQKQYEEHMHHLEEKMKQRLDEYLSSTATSLQNSHREPSPPEQYRPMGTDLINHYYPSHSSTHIPSLNLSRSQSREDMSNVRLDLTAKHAKHVSDLKSYYEHEIEELKNQVDRTRMGHTTSSTRQSMEAIERMNNENIRLHDEVKELRRSLKSLGEENNSINRKLEELRSQLNGKEVELKSSHRNLAELEQQLTDAHHIKERQDERFRHADRQALIYREENEKLKIDLNMTRERLARLEERLRDQENENKTRRPPIFPSDTSNHRHVDETTKFNSTMSLNMPTSREYGRFTLTNSRYSSSTINTSRDVSFDSSRYNNNTNGTDDLLHSPRPLNRINEIPSSSFHPPPRPLYSPRKSPPTRHHPLDPMPDLIDNQIKHSEQLEEKFDQLLRKKRDLEARMNRIPSRTLTNTDRQLLETLEREIERVEQQISSVKLELRKLNILRTH